MKKDKYNIVELSIIYFLLLNGFTSIFIKGLSLPLIISITIGYFINSYLIDKNNKIFILISIIYSFFIGIFILINTSFIITDYITPNHNLFIISILFIFISIFLSSKGLKSIIIASNLLFIIYIIVILISFTSNIFNINISNINSNILDNNNIISPLISLITPILFFSIIPKHKISNYIKYKDSLKKTYILFSIYLIIKILFISSIIRINNINNISYYEITLYNLIKIDYIKNLLIINILIERFIMLSVIIYYIKKRLNCRFL